MSKEKSSKTLMVFGTLIIIGVITTLVFLCLTKYNPHYWDDVLLSFGAVNLIGVCFLIYIKEIRIKEKWSEIPLVAKFIWWFIFVSNSYGFIDTYMTAFIF
ncbi:hypothetical protein ACW5UC_23820 [Priestia aryabhattai]|uniref:hypothetical protein n=1 Tax=Priestia megaterium TaxID=1404 RepID=UPI003F977C0F